MNKIYVIAGNGQQALDWIRKNQSETDMGMGDYVIVRDANSLLGAKEPHGVFVGTWKQRVDLMQILNHLYLITPNNPIWRTLIKSGKFQ